MAPATAEKVRQVRRGRLIEIKIACGGLCLRVGEARTDRPGRVAAKELPT